MLAERRIRQRAGVSAAAEYERLKREWRRPSVARTYSVGKSGVASPGVRTAAWCRNLIVTHDRFPSAEGADLDSLGAL